VGDPDDSYVFSALDGFVEKLRAGYDLGSAIGFGAGLSGRDAGVAQTPRQSAPRMTRSFHAFESVMSHTRAPKSQNANNASAVAINPSAVYGLLTLQRPIGEIIGVAP